ncbi:MAG: hypothetical protein RLO08_13945 [Parvibaculaceae bacterium]
MEQLSVANATEICREFGITGERRDAFDQFIAEFESEWEVLEVLNRPLGAERLRRIQELEQHLEAVVEGLRATMTAPEAVDRYLRWRTSSLTIGADGSLDLYLLYGQYGLPAPATDAETATSPEVQRAALDLLSRHGLALLHHALDDRRRYLQAVQEFSADNAPKRKGRPVHRERQDLLDRIVRQHATFLDLHPSYADGQPFVRFCERMLEAYKMERGDTAQLVKRALKRNKPRPMLNPWDPGYFD